MHEGQHSVVAVKFPLILSGWVRKQWHLTFNCLTPAAAAQLRLRRSNQSTPNFPGRCSNRRRSAHNNISKSLFDLWSLPTDDSRGGNKFMTKPPISHLDGCWLNQSQALDLLRNRRINEYSPFNANYVGRLELSERGFPTQVLLLLQLWPPHLILSNAAPGDV